MDPLTYEEKWAIAAEGIPPATPPDSDEDL
jgi:hypothetical protein